MSYEEFMLSSVLKPLGLHNTKMFRSDAIQSGTLAQGHRANMFRSTPFTKTIARSHTPTGFILSNLIDVTKWLSLHLNPSNAPYPFYKLINEGHIPNTGMTTFGTNQYYALGWHVDLNSGIIHHPGIIPGFVNHVMFCPSKNTAIVVLMNSSSGHSINLVENIFALTLGLKTGSIAIGSDMRVLDIIFSALIILFIVLTTTLLVILIFRIIALRKKHIVFKRPSIKGIISISATALFFVLILLLTLLAPIIFGIGWHMVVIWLPPTIFTLIIFVFLAILFAGLLVILRILRAPKIQDTAVTY